jgi:hypothetical protein
MTQLQELVYVVGLHTSQSTYQWCRHPHTATSSDNDG